MPTTTREINPRCANKFREWRCPNLAKPGRTRCERCLASATPPKVANARRGEANWIAVQAAKNRPCVDCGRTLPSGLMHLDHVRGKNFQLSKDQMRRGRAVIAAEIALCDTRCVVCHFARHEDLEWQAVWASILGAV